MPNLRYAARQLRQSPGFALTAILTLALGIGATTAIFSAVYALLLASLPFQDAGRLVSIGETYPQIPGAMEVTYPDYQDWQSQQRSFTGLAAWSTINPGTVSVHFNGHAEQLHRVLASGNFFSLLGVSAQLGRTLNPNDEVAGSDHVAVLSDAAWQTWFGRDTSVLSRPIDINGASFTIVGILPAGASFPAEGELWLPLSLLDTPTRNSHVWHSVKILGRLRDGVDIASARLDMHAVNARIAAAYPATNGSIGVAVTPLREQLVGSLRAPMLCLMGAVSLVLLIACANVASLLMVRAAARQHEVAIRQALGATRAQLFLQHLTQAILLCLLGGILGTALAAAALPLLRVALAHTAAGEINAEMIAGIGLNLPVLLATMAACFLTAIVFGLIPVLRLPASSSVGVETLRLGSRPGARNSSVAQSALIAGEIAIAAAVLFLSTLVMRSYQKLAAVDTGFRTDHLLSAEIELPQPRYDDTSPATNHFYEQLLDKLNSTPSILSAGTTTQTPLKSSEVVTRFAIEGTPRPQAGAYPVAQIRYVSPAFFRTIGLRLLEGRVFNQQDIDQNRSLFIVNETFAKRYLAGRNPIGAKVIVGVLSPHPDVTPVIGVVADAHDLGVDRNPQPELYIPGFGLHAVLLVRSNAVADTGSLETIVRQAVHSVSPDQPVFHIQSADAILADSLARPRMTQMLLGIFAGIALALAAIGIYGVLSVSVAQRTREIGIRMAIGASRTHVLRIILTQAARFTTVGLACGMLASFICARLLSTQLSSLLFETRALDPFSIAITLAVLATVAILAATLPAARAAQTNPASTLRAE
jgi:predicted permease